jgi:hypothetical protein
MNKFAVKAWCDCHEVPTIFLVIDEDECELGRVPSVAEAVSKAVALEEESRLLQELATAASDAAIADIFARYKDFRESLPPTPARAPPSGSAGHNRRKPRRRIAASACSRQPNA